MQNKIENLQELSIVDSAAWKKTSTFFVAGNFVLEELGEGKFQLLRDNVILLPRWSSDIVIQPSNIWVPSGQQRGMYYLDGSKMIRLDIFDSADIVLSPIAFNNGFVAVVSDKSGLSCIVVRGCKIKSKRLRSPFLVPSPFPGNSLLGCFSDSVFEKSIWNVETDNTIQAPASSVRPLSDTLLLLGNNASGFDVFDCTTGARSRFPFLIDMGTQDYLYVRDKNNTASVFVFYPAFHQLPNSNGATFVWSTQFGTPEKKWIVFQKEGRFHLWCYTKESKQWSSIEVQNIILRQPMGFEATGLDGDTCYIYAHIPLDEQTYNEAGSVPPNYFKQNQTNNDGY